MSALSRRGLFVATSRNHQPFTFREWLQIGFGGAAFLLWMLLLVLAVMGAGEPGPLCEEPCTRVRATCTGSGFPAPPDVECGR